MNEEKRRGWVGRLDRGILDFIRRYPMSSVDAAVETVAGNRRSMGYQLRASEALRRIGEWARSGVLQTHDPGVGFLLLTLPEKRDNRCGKARQPVRPRSVK